MKTCYEELPTEMINEDEGIYTIGDDILSSFYYGNYSQAIKDMVSQRIEPYELAEYFQSILDDFDADYKEIYNGHFDFELFAHIGMSYYQEISK